MFGLSRIQSLRAGLLLASGGEFAFVALCAHSQFNTLYLVANLLLIVFLTPQKAFLFHVSKELQPPGLWQLSPVWRWCIVRGVLA